MIKEVLWCLLAAPTVLSSESPVSDSQPSDHSSFDSALERWGLLFQRGVPLTDSEKREEDDKVHLGPTLLLSATTSVGSCDGSTTYYGQTPSTVYATVTQGFDVTVADNATFTAQETLYTPPVPCTFTVLPAPLAPSSAQTTSPPFNNNTQNTMSHHHPLPQDSTQTTLSWNPTPPSAIVTVTVTKKTPVQVPPGQTSPQVQFPTQPPQNTPNEQTQRPNPPVTDPTTHDNTPQPIQSTTPSNPTPANTPNTPNNPTTKDGGDTPQTTQNANSPASNNAPVNSPTGTGLGSIINSIFNSPFTPAGTSFGTAAPSATRIHGVSVQVQPSGVWIGGQSVALPSNGQQSTVVVNGETFTVEPTAVIIGGSTVTIGRQESVTQAPQTLSIVPLATSTITRNGITITIGPSQAILSGTTYRIGPQAAATTVTIDTPGNHQGNGGGKQTITFDSDGVVFPSTTYNPALTVVDEFVVTTIGPGITISIDMLEAVLNGSTYNIGSGATTTSTIVNGTTIYFGPSGVIVPGVTTLGPTSVDAATTTPGMGVANSAPATNAASGSSPVQTAGTSNGVSLQRNDKISTLMSAAFTLAMFSLGVFL